MAPADANLAVRSSLPAARFASAPAAFPCVPADAPAPGLSSATSASMAPADAILALRSSLPYA
eukprot:10871-Chlamydomonas_euryale.AAC.1